MKSDKQLVNKKVTLDISKIHLYYRLSDAWLCGFRFFDGAGKIIYDSAAKWAYNDSVYKQHEILLNEGERIIGF